MRQDDKDTRDGDGQPRATEESLQTRQEVSSRTWRRRLRLYRAAQARCGGSRAHSHGTPQDPTRQERVGAGDRPNDRPRTACPGPGPSLPGLSRFGRDALV